MHCENSRALNSDARPRTLRRRAECHAGSSHAIDSTRTQFAFRSATQIARTFDSSSNTSANNDDDDDDDDDGDSQTRSSICSTLRRPPSASRRPYRLPAWRKGNTSFPDVQPSPSIHRRFIRDQSFPTIVSNFTSSVFRAHTDDVISTAIRHTDRIADLALRNNPPNAP